MKTVEETRHDNLLAILGEFGREHGEHGALQVLATAMGKAHSQLSQIKTRAKHSKTGKPRNIGSKLAREIETAAGKPPGWLDVPHGPAEDLNAKLARLVNEAVDKRIGVQASPDAALGKRTGTA
jgi:hypothetical protein